MCRVWPRNQGGLNLDIFSCLPPLRSAECSRKLPGRQPSQRTQVLLKHHAFGRGSFNKQPTAGQQHASQTCTLKPFPNRSNDCFMVTVTWKSRNWQFLCHPKIRYLLGFFITKVCFRCAGAGPPSFLGSPAPVTYWPLCKLLSVCAALSRASVRTPSCWLARSGFFA